MCGAPYTVCLLILVAKLETSHVLQSNKKQNLQGSLRSLISVYRTLIVSIKFERTLLEVLLAMGINETRYFWDKLIV